MPTIFKPTRVAGSSCTLIDNIFASNVSEFSSGIFTILFSDHLPIFIISKIMRQFNPKPPVTISYCIINDSIMDKTFQSFSRDNLVNYIEYIEYIDIDESINLLNSEKFLHFNIHCPIKTKYVSTKDIIKPWIKQSFKIKNKKRQSYMQLFKRNLTTKTVYNLFSNFVKNEIRNLKKLL